MSVDLTQPVSEIEIAELNEALSPAGSAVLRRLAYQRDALEAENARLREVLTEAIEGLRQNRIALGEHYQRSLDLATKMSRALQGGTDD